jgi:CubicO group peptidase (beta-lactamase class C family)
MDVQGYIIKKLSLRSMPDFMHDHIFAPLKMKDSGFFVPKEKRDRFATLYGEDAGGALKALTPLPTLGVGDCTSQPTMPRLRIDMRVFSLSIASR